MKSPRFKFGDRVRLKRPLVKKYWDRLWSTSGLVIFYDPPMVRVARRGLKTVDEWHEDCWEKDPDETLDS